MSLQRIPRFKPVNPSTSIIKPLKPLSRSEVLQSLAKSDETHVFIILKVNENLVGLSIPKNCIEIKQTNDDFRIELKEKGNEFLEKALTDNQQICTALQLARKLGSKTASIFTTKTSLPIELTAKNKLYIIYPYTPTNESTERLPYKD